MDFPSKRKIVKKIYVAFLVVFRYVCNGLVVRTKSNKLCRYIEE